MQRFLKSYRQLNSQQITAVPITDLDPALLPSFPADWADIRSLHQPPAGYVLFFQAGQGQIMGYCHLNPDFPGCFPFVINEPGPQNVSDSLFSLQKYLNPEKEILKLTLAAEALAEACGQLGFELNYELFKMEHT